MRRGEEDNTGQLHLLCAVVVEENAEKSIM